MIVFMTGNALTITNCWWQVAYRGQFCEGRTCNTKYAPKNLPLPMPWFLLIIWPGEGKFPGQHKPLFGGKQTKLYFNL